MADITLTLPCPICGHMLRALYEPQQPSDTPLLAEVSGCPHADEVMVELDGQARCSPGVSLALWEALHREAEQYCLDRYTDQLEARHGSRLREEC